MVNACFFDDPHRRRNTSENEWRTAAGHLKNKNGFGGFNSPWLADVFLRAREHGDFFAAAT
jgi:hypothetical protein